MCYMKKILLCSVVMLIGIASFAQKKGDMFIAGSISADFGTQKYILSDEMDHTLLLRVSH